MVQFEDFRDIGDSLLEVRYLLIVISQFDEGCHQGEALGIEDEIPVRERVEIGFNEEEIRAGLDRKETSSRDIDAVSPFEMSDSCTDGGFQL